MKNKKIIGLGVLTTLVVAGCSCGTPQTIEPDIYEVDGFLNPDGTKMQFGSFDEFSKYLIESGTITYNHQADYWKINGLNNSTNKYDTEQEAVNAYLAIFDPERYSADQVLFDANGIATSIKMDIDTATVYETRTHEWTTDARTAYQSYVDTDYSGLYYSINANGLDLESRSLEDLIGAFKSNINHQAATKIAPVAKTGVAEGDYITSGGVNYTWKNQTYYQTSQTVTPIPGAFMVYKGLPYEYVIEHRYIGTTNVPTVIFIGGTGQGITSRVQSGEIVRIYSKDSTGAVQTFAGNRLRNIDYTNGIDYQWNDAAKRLVIMTDKYFKEDGTTLPADTTAWEKLDCNVPIGHSKSVYPCFTESDINTKSGKIFEARDAETIQWGSVQPPHATTKIRYTNVDNHAKNYSVKAEGTNKAGWYLRVDGLKSIIDMMDCADLYNPQLNEATLYYHSSNTNSNPSLQLTTSFNDSLTSTQSNPAAFYAPGFAFTSDAIEGVDYILWDNNSTYYPTTNALAGARQLSTLEADAYVVSNEYWWIGNAVHVTYTSLEAAQAGAEQIVRALVTSEWRVGTFFGTGEYYTSQTSQDDAFNTFMLLNRLNQKIVDTTFLNGTITEFDKLPEFVANDPIIVYKIPGYDNYFDSKIDAFNWYKVNVGVPVSKVIGADTYTIKGINATTKEELAQKVWDAYSKKIN